MEFYIDPADQAPGVHDQIKSVTPSSLDPEALTMLDPACGSCHILVEGYDLFKAIYLERGYRIDEAAVNAFVGDAVIVIAHNSGFDRKFAERYWPAFEHKAWSCSATEIDWRAHGFAGAQLGYLLNGAGLFHNAHRAVDDCHALLEILDFTLPTTGAPALASLLETARKKTVRVWAEQSPFELKDALKKRGYRWSDGADGRPRAWYIDICETVVETELSFLKTEIYKRDVELPQQILTAFTRFSSRV